MCISTYFTCICLQTNMIKKAGYVIMFIKTITSFRRSMRGKNPHPNA